MNRIFGEYKTEKEKEILLSVLKELGAKERPKFLYIIDGFIEEGDIDYSSKEGWTKITPF